MSPPTPRNRARRPHGALALLVAGLLVAAGLATSCTRSDGSPAAAKGSQPTEVKGGAPGKGGGRPVPVTVAAAVIKAVPLELNTFGTVRPMATVAVKSQVTERLRQTHIRKGQKVAAGDLLFTIETKPFEVGLRQAQAALARDKVQAANARREAEREAELLKAKFAAQADYDKALADAEALAQVVKADEAAVDNAQLQLDYCLIRSPLAGRAGDLMVDEGNQIKANDATLVVINQLSPIEVAFAAPQADLARIRLHQARGDLTATATIPDDPGPPEVGKLTFINNTVDEATGSIQLGATFPNDTDRLWPGQYVRVKLTLAAERAIVVPARGVQTGQTEPYVAVLQPDQTVVFRTVKVGRSAGDDVVIESGVQAGDQVVTDGHLQLLNGSKVEVRGPDAKGTSGGEKHADTPAASPADGAAAGKEPPAAGTGKAAATGAAP